jgi:hypothetical protein
MNAQGTAPWKVWRQPTDTGTDSLVAMTAGA